VDVISSRQATLPRSLPLTGFPRPPGTPRFYRPLTHCCAPPAANTETLIFHHALQSFAPHFEDKHASLSLSLPVPLDSTPSAGRFVISSLQLQFLKHIQIVTPCLSTFYSNSSSGTLDQQPFLVSKPEKTPGETPHRLLDRAATRLHRLEDQSDSSKSVQLYANIYAYTITINAFEGRHCSPSNFVITIPEPDTCVYNRRKHWDIIHHDRSSDNSLESAVLGCCIHFRGHGGC
jgi:hypothetical protein